MYIQSSHLEAFAAVARHLSFSKGAKSLHITQSAISHRIRNLEEELNVGLFNRHPSGISLTTAGELLLKFSNSRSTLEEELVRELSSQMTGSLAGSVSICGYSSVLRSVIIPAVSPFLKKHPNVECSFICQNSREIANLLQKGHVEYAVTDYGINKSSIESILIGYESFVVIESSKYETQEHIYLDNAPDDMVTEAFLRAQSATIPNYSRLFMNDCYGIIDGVEQGLGRAVMPAHLLKGNTKVKIIQGYKPYFLKVYLHYYAQPFYSTLQKKIIKQLSSATPKYLSKP